MRPVGSGSTLRIPSSRLPNRPHWPGSPGHPCTTGRWESRRKRFGFDTGLMRSIPYTPFTEAERWPLPFKRKGFPWEENAFRRLCGRWASKAFTRAPILANGIFSTGSIRTFSGTWFPALLTMSGESMSPIFGSSTDGCIWWQPSTGMRGMSFLGA